METHTHPLAYNPSLSPSCLLDPKVNLSPIVKKKKKKKISTVSQAAQHMDRSCDQWNLTCWNDGKEKVTQH